MHRQQCWMKQQYMLLFKTLSKLKLHELGLQKESTRRLHIRDNGMNTWFFLSPNWWGHEFNRYFLPYVECCWTRCTDTLKLMSNGSKQIARRIKVMKQKDIRIFIFDHTVVDNTRQAKRSCIILSCGKSLIMVLLTSQISMLCNVQSIHHSGF